MPPPDNLVALIESLSPDELLLLERELEKIPPADALALSPRQMRVSTRSRLRSCYDLSKVRNAVTQIRKLPTSGESIHCLMGGDYNAADLIPALQTLAAAPIDELHISTLGFNKTNTSQLCTLFDARLVLSINIVCSHYFTRTEPDTYAFAQRELHARRQKIVSTRTHAKVLALRIGKARYVVESSANLRSCNNLEQFTLTRSTALFRFHRAWMNHLHRHAIQ